MHERIKKIRLPEMTHLMAYLIGFCMLWELEKKINFPGSSTIYHWIQIGELVMTGALLTKLPLRANRWYWLLMAGVVLIFLTSAMRTAPALEKTEPFLLRAVPVYLLCPAVGMLLVGEPLKRFLKAFLGIWTVLYVILAMTGIYCVMNGIEIKDYTGSLKIGLLTRKLDLFDGKKIYAAINLALSIAMALVGFAISEKRAVKALYSAGILVMFLSLVITGGRAGLVSALTGIGLTVVCMLQKHICRRITGKWIRKLVAAVLIIVIIGVGIGADYLIEDAFNNILTSRKSGGLFVSSAQAQEMTVTQKKVKTVIMKDFFNEKFLNGRDKAWIRGVQVLAEKPYLLLTGTSLPLMTEYLNPDPDETFFYHVHNMPLLILLSTGILGLALCAAFLILFFQASGRLLFDLERPMWERLIMVPSVCIIVHEMVDCVTMLNTKRSPANMIMMFFAGLTIVLGSRNYGKKTEKANG